MKEVLKIGKTYIHKENITLDDYRKESNNENYYISWKDFGFEQKPEITEEVLNTTISGKWLKNDEKVHWWVSDWFFEKNYKIIDQENEKIEIEIKGIEHIREIYNLQAQFLEIIIKMTAKTKEFELSHNLRNLYRKISEIDSREG